MLMALSMMSRPQISIDRLPPRRSANEPRELMNCKSCRKRKVGSENPPVAGGAMLTLPTLRSSATD
jgi:hypothetical protein